MKRSLSILLLVLGTGTVGCADHPFDSAAYEALTYQQEFFFSDCAPVGEPIRVDLTREASGFAMTGVLLDGVEPDCVGADCAMNGGPLERELTATDLASLHLALDEATLKADDTVCPSIGSCLHRTLTVDGESFTTGCGVDKLEGADMTRIVDELTNLLSQAE